jgi:hypothetical protein
MVDNMQKYLKNFNDFHCEPHAAVSCVFETTQYFQLVEQMELQATVTVESLSKRELPTGRFWQFVVFQLKLGYNDNAQV